MRANQEEMDKYNVLEFISEIFSIDDRKFIAKFRRTPNAFRLEVFYDGRVVSSAYMMYLNNKRAELRRVYTVPDFRGIGLGSKMLEIFFRYFGMNEFYLTPSPNRIKEMTPETKEDYRKRLIKFYESFGFVRKSETNFSMVRKAD